MIVNDRYRYRARDKIVQKMSRDGLTEENRNSGKKIRISRKQKEQMPSLKQEQDMKFPCRKVYVKEREVWTKDRKLQKEPPKRLKQYYIKEFQKQASKNIFLKNGRIGDNATTGKEDCETGETQEKLYRLSFTDENRSMISGYGLGIAKKTAHVLVDSVSGREEEQEEDTGDTTVEAMHKAECVLGHSARYIVRSTSRRMEKKVCFENRILAESSAEKTGEETRASMQKFWQKQRIRKSYQMAKQKEKSAEQTAQATQTIAARVKHVAAEVFKRNRSAFVVAGFVFMLFSVLFTGMSACGAMMQGITASFVGTTYPSEDEDIYATETDYAALEEALQQRIDQIESFYAGYDEYHYQLDEIFHDPYQLISYLTVIYEEFIYAQVRDALANLFAEQYLLTLEEKTEIRTRQNDASGEWEEYEYHILCVSLENKGLDTVVRSHMTEPQAKRYEAYNGTYGNRSYLFQTDDPLSGGEHAVDFVYQLPEEVLSDEVFVNMLREAEKYLGYPYVWGGSSPETGFDCSGYVSYVLNNCGNGWNVGRLGAEGLRQICSYISVEDAQPGDLVFFEGTYDTTGTSHVGIYVGDNKMIHAGSPVKYADISSAYWQSHFLSFGRIPGRGGG